MFGYSDLTPRERYDVILDNLDAMYDSLKRNAERAESQTEDLEERVDSLLDEVQASQEALQISNSKTNVAYSQRAIAAVAFAHTVISLGGRAGVGRDSREDQPEAWRLVLYVDTPAGQLSWHISPSDQCMLEGIPPYEGLWDGTYNSSNADFYKEFLK